MSLAPRLALASVDQPLEAARMRFRRVAAHHHREVGVLDIGPRLRHRATAERRAQTGHRRAVSNPRLVVEGDHAGRAHHLVGEERRLVGGGRGCPGSPRRGPAVDRPYLPCSWPGSCASRSSFIKRAIRSSASSHDTLRRTRRNAGLAHPRVRSCRVSACDEVLERRPLGAERAAVGRVVDVALDVGDLGASHPSASRPSNTG